jgi:hypothetical protein
MKMLTHPMPNATRENPALPTETIMADHIRLANTQDTMPRDIGDFVRTETAVDIHRSLDLVRQIGGPAMTMIAGVPGTGKTEALKNYAAQHAEHGVYLQAVRGEGTPWNFAHSLGDFWGYAKPTFRTVQEARMAFGHYLGQNSLLIIDEGQYLNQKNRRTGQTGEAIEWLRGTAETWGFLVALCGDLSLLSVVSSMPQVQSRMRRPVIIQEVNRSDVTALAQDTGFDSPDAISVLVAVARQKGGLRRRTRLRGQDRHNGALSGA